MFVFVKFKLDCSIFIQRSSAFILEFWINVFSNQESFSFCVTSFENIFLRLICLSVSFCLFFCFCLSVAFLFLEYNLTLPCFAEIILVTNRDFELVFTLTFIISLEENWPANNCPLDNCRRIITSGQFPQKCLRPHNIPLEISPEENCLLDDLSST